MRMLTALALALALVGCNRPVRNSVMRVSVVVPGRDAAPSADADAKRDLLAASVDLPLLRLDGEGEVTAGFAIRWAIGDDGRSVILRIADDPDLRAGEVATRLHGLARSSSADPFARIYADMASAAAVTDQIVELRLATARPDLLTLLAQPRLAKVGRSRGPYRITGRTGDALQLAPIAPMGDVAPEAVLLRGERAGKAVARFAAGRTDLVLGGGFAELPVARAATLPAGSIVFDAASGLLGLAWMRPTVNRALLAALTIALDRDRIVAAIDAPGLVKATTPNGSAIEPPSGERRARAAQMLRAAGIAPGTRLTLAMPDGPGVTLLFRLVQADWSAIGIGVDRVTAGDEADLKLIDLVLPAGERARAACAASPACDPADDAALLDPPYIPIAAPLRWSLVGRRVRGFAENGMAAHPLDMLQIR